MGATSLLEQLLMYLSDEAQRQWKRRQPAQPEVHGPYIVDDFIYVLGYLVGARTEIDRKQILERTLRSLDLGAENRLPVYVHGYEEIWVRHVLGNAVQPSDCEVRV